MNGHLARRACACLFGSLLLGVTAAHAQEFPFPYQAVTYSLTLDNPYGGEATGFGSSVGVDGLTVLVGIPYYGPTDSYGFPTAQGRVAVFTADAATGEDEIERVRVTDETGQAHGAAVDERDAPAPAVHTEHRVTRGR